MSLDPRRVATALRAIISDIDYDLHKEIEAEDDYAYLVGEFIKVYGEVE